MALAVLSLADIWTMVWTKLYPSYLHYNNAEISRNFNLWIFSLEGQLRREGMLKHASRMQLWCQNPVGFLLPSITKALIQNIIYALYWSMLNQKPRRNSAKVEQNRIFSSLLGIPRRKYVLVLPQAFMIHSHFVFCHDFDPPHQRLFGAFCRVLPTGLFILLLFFWPVKKNNWDQF